MKKINFLALGLLALNTHSALADYSWNLSRDLMTGNVTNSGNTTSSWTLYEDPGLTGNYINYQPLSKAATCTWMGTAHPEYACWQKDSYRDPFIGINTTSTTNPFPKGNVILHPRNYLQPIGAVIGWKAPQPGYFSVTLAISDVDQSCGDGVSWNLKYLGLTQASGTVTNGQHISFVSSAPIKMNGQETLYLTISANQDELCDTTALDMMVLQTK